MSAFGSARISLSGPSGEVRIELAIERTSVGRTRDNHVILNDPAISSRHCEFVFDARGLLMRDLNSSNGSFVNGQRVQEAFLFDGDRIRLGQLNGRIEVRGPDGRLLRAPTDARGLLRGAAVLALLVLAGSLLAWRSMSLQEEQRELFDRYEAQAKVLLLVDPCLVAEETLPRLRAIDRSRPALDFGRNGKLEKAQKAQNDTSLEVSRLKEPVVRTLLEKLSHVVERQKTGLDALRESRTGLRDDATTSAADAIERMFAERLLMGDEFHEKWRHYYDQLVEYDTLLTNYNATGEKRLQEELAGWKFRVEPDRLTDECSGRFADSAKAALQRLAEVSF